MEQSVRDERKLSVWTRGLLAAAVCVVITALSCVRKSQAPVAGAGDPGVLAKPAQQIAQLTIFFTGNTLGSLKPCGCSGGQLGGLDRRSAIFSKAPKENRLIADTGSLVPSDSVQNGYKFTILNRAFKLLGYDVVNLSEEDLQIAGNQGLLTEPMVDFISSYEADGEQVGRSFTKHYTLDGESLNVLIVPFDPRTMSVEDVSGLVRAGSGGLDVSFLVLNHCEEGTVEAIRQGLPSLDCLVCPAEGDEPHLISEPGEKPLVFSTGRYGKYVCQVQVARPLDDGERPALSFTKLGVTEDYDSNELLVQLYKDYQRIVRGSGLLEVHPRYNLENDLKYVGSEACRLCHEHDKECDKWDTTRHADAYATLEEAGSEADPECVGCHVIGFEYNQGFMTKEKTPELTDVGCENCHGPGSKHISSAGAVEPGQPRSTCEDCHTPDHSGEYGANKEKYLEKIIHW